MSPKRADTSPTADTPVDHATTVEALRRENADLRERLREATETIDAIHAGDVDAVVVGDRAGRQQVYTLEGADRPYRFLIEEMQEGALMLAPSGAVVYCNRALAQMLGTTAETVIGNAPRTLVAAGEHVRLDRLLNERGRGEFTLVSETGTERPVQISFSDLPAIGGEHLCCGIVADLTEPNQHAREMGVAQARLAAEAGVRESEARYRLILESATDYAIIATDLEDRVTIWNAGARLILGWEEAETLGQPVPMIWTPEDRAAGVPETEMRLARQTGRAEDERWHLRKDETRFWANGLLMPLRGDADRLLGYLKILRDRTEARRSEQALRELNDTLERRVEERTAALARETAERATAEEQLRQAQKMQALGQLTGGIAHDFNNLLTIIQGSTDFLRRPDLSAERRLRYVDAIADTASRAASLTQQLLAFARKQPLRPEVFDLNARLHGMVAMLGRALGALYQTQLDLAPNLHLIEVDPNQLEIALLNIGVNARDAMPTGGMLTIRTRNADVHDGEGDGLIGAFVCLSVSDTGSGMPPDVLARVFEPFFTTKEVGKGTGLGLSQVYGFAAQSGGDVRIESVAAEGTTVIMRLPRARNLPAAALPEEIPDAFKSGYGVVLLVEDNPEVGAFAQLLLEELGYGVVRAETAAAALEVLQKGMKVDIVFSDVVMPGMTGIELARQLHREHPTLPVVLTTGYSDTLAREGAGEFPMLFKPYRTETLGAILRGTLARNGLSVPKREV